jgi:hypothetical protein
MDDLGNNLAGLKNRLIGDDTPTYQRVDPSSLKPASRLAISAFEMEKGGLLEGFPAVRVDPLGKNLSNTMDYSAFRQRNVIVLRFQENPDGSYCQDMLCESTDTLGRIDVRRNYIAFTVRQPDAKESIELTQSLLDASRALKASDAHVQQDFGTAVRDYQSVNGLVPDGVFGPATATSVSQTLSILDIGELTSEIHYPSEPKSMLYVLPYDTIAAAPDRFNQGYASLDAIKQEALSNAEFKQQALPSRQFVLFLYFLDRVSPGKAISMCLATSERQWTHCRSPAKYAQPGAWPVLTEILSIDEALDQKRLYVNVFLRGKFMDDCIASHQIM